MQSIMTTNKKRMSLQFTGGCGPHGLQPSPNLEDAILENDNPQLAEGSEYRAVAAFLKFGGECIPFAGRLHQSHFFNINLGGIQARRYLERRNSRHSDDQTASFDLEQTRD